jgi:lipopolysaccharide assembly protein A
LRKLIVLIVVILAVLAGASFTLLNSGSVPLNLYAVHLDMPLSVVIFSSLLIGAILGVFACMGLMLRHVRDNRQLHKRVRLAEDELSKLRRLPIKDHY